MDASEKLALAYLSALGFSQTVYEPDGKVPPDFLLNGEIAVEVRRLNYNKLTSSGRYEGLESSQIALMKMMRATLALFGPPREGKSWFVGYRFSRPLPHLPKLRRKVHEALKDFLEGRRNLEDNELEVTDRFTLTLFPLSSPRPTCFTLATASDHDTAGWAASLLQQNIRLCIEEKTRKIARFRSKYAQWWLVLVDHIGYGTPEQIQVRHDLDKVLIVNPLDPKCGYEL
jgi:hypothetical protein